MEGNTFRINDNVSYIGVYDKTLDLFENQYKTPEGISYNSYLIEGEKTAVVDTTDDRTGEEWLCNLRKALGDRKPDYLIIEHLEPDHSSLLTAFVEAYPEATLVISAVGAKMLPLYMTDLPWKAPVMTVKDGDSLDLGGVTLQFFTAPMVHWPEVIMAYCPQHKLLFSADAFGTFGNIDTPHGDWAREARRYYYNIVGKYGQQVQNVLKKLSGLEIETICPLHGPVLTGDVAPYIGYYDAWSSYRPEKEGVMIACASIHGSTLEAARYLEEILRKRGVDVFVADLTREDVSAMAAEAFRYPEAVMCASTYDAGLFTPMHSFLHLLEIKGYRDRKVAIIENGSWAPMAGKIMKKTLEEMKGIDIVADPITLRGIFKAEDRKAIEQLADKL